MKNGKLVIRKLSEEEFRELEPLLVTGGANSVAHEILKIMQKGENGDKFYMKKTNYQASSISYINSVAKKKFSGYDFKVSIRTMKDKTGWVLLRLLDDEKK